jgi:hypothetical protein
VSMHIKSYAEVSSKFKGYAMCQCCGSWRLPSGKQKTRRLRRRKEKLQLKKQLTVEC